MGCKVCCNHNDCANANDKEYSVGYANKLGKRISNDTETVLNWYENKSAAGMTLGAINNGKSAAKNSTTCPKYLMLRTEKDYSSYELYASNSQIIAEQFVSNSNSGNWYAWVLNSKAPDGHEYTKEEYYSTFATTTESVYDPNATVTCTDLFGDINDDGKTNDVDNDGVASIAYMVDSVLQVVRWVVPILIILLGTIDLSKAVIASKEDEMRKAQLTFIKRLLLGVVVFFVPLVVNVVMELTDVVWEDAGYSVCEYK